MKRFAGMMGALLLVPTLALASGDMVSISELRQQVEAMERWTQTYEAHARYILGMSNVEIAKAEGVSKAAITYSIQRGMRELARRVKKF